MLPISHATRLILAGLAAALPGAAGAQTAPADDSRETQEVRRYAVEIILFRYAESVPTGNERFLPEPPPAPESTLANDEDPRDFGDPSVVPATSAAPPAPADTVLDEIRLPTRLVDLQVSLPQNLKLTDVHQKLVTLDAYQPVLWAGWTQDAVEREHSPVIPLRRIGNAPPEFDGSLQLYLSRFLHLVVDLSMSPRATTGPGAARSYSDRPAFDRVDGRRSTGMPGVVHLRIDEDRIVKDGELRYFDHPRFGLLARVTRIDDDDPETADAGDDTDALLPPE